LKSGSKKSPARPPELAAWQDRALERVAASWIATEAVFGGGAALAALYLHHRVSEDLDFFLSRELEPGEAARLAKTLAVSTATTRLEVVGPRTSVNRTDNRDLVDLDGGKRKVSDLLTDQSMVHTQIGHGQAERRDFGPLRVFCSM
jgi:predicted nucleotidyltransferase component of viral defense system